MTLVTDLFPGAEVRDWATSATAGWCATNPSIAFHPEGGYRATIRMVNYVMEEAALTYPTEDPDDAIRTKTLLAVCDSQWNVLDAEPIDDTDVQQNAYRWVRGMEDCRVYFGLDGSWHAYGTLREHRADGLPEMADDTLRGAKVVKRTVMVNPEPGRCQKNHMILGQGPYFVYLCSPPTVLHPGGTLERALGRDLPEVDLRGGSQAVPYKGGYLAAVHEVTWGDNPRRYYAHRLVRFDEQGFTTSWTKPFCFRSPGVEFAAGLVVQDDRVVISVGYKDRSCLLATIPVASLPW